MAKFSSADILKEQDGKKKLAFLEVGLFEISFVLIVIIVFFGLLNYFNILSLSKLYPDTFGFLPHKTFNPTPLKKTQLTNSPLPVPTPTQANDISVVSDVPGYNLTIVDKSVLINYLNKLDIWGKTFNDPTNPVILHNIELHLSNDNQKLQSQQKVQDGNPLYSYNLLFINNTLKLNIYLYPDVLTDANSSKVLSNVVMIIMSRVNLSEKGGKSMSEDQTNKIQNEFVNKNFFLLQKNP